ncbi:MAG: MFS transporter [Dehalococcoidia bacterium]|nr:MAG: MFS transporter [Dehalococcoidia bacterium]
MARTARRPVMRTPRGLRPGVPAWVSLSSYRRRIWSTVEERWFYADGILSSVSESVVVQFLSIYAITLGASDAQVGLLAIANGLAGILALVPGAALAERTPSRKWVVLAGGGGAGRLAILAMAGVPLLFDDVRTAVYALVALTFVKSLAGAACHPSWVSLLADIFPIDRRAFCVSQRMLSLTVAAAVAAPIAGVAIRVVGGTKGFQVAFLAAFAVGLASTYSYARIPERPRAPRRERPAGSTRAVLRDAAFVRYLTATLLLHTSAMVVGPFLAVYLVRDLHAQPGQVGLIASIEAGGAILGQFALGLFVARKASASLFRTLLCTMPFVPLLWLLPRTWWHAALPSVSGGAAWAAHNVLSFNLLMEYAPPANLPRYAAIQQMVILAASFFGPAIGTWVVGVSDIRTAMLVSAIGRWIAALVLIVPLGAPRPAPPSSTSGG